MNERTPTTGCLPDATIAAWLDGTLDPQQRHEVSEHLAECERCREIAAETAEFLELDEESGHPAAASDSPAVVKPFPTRTILAVAALVVAAIAIGILMSNRDGAGHSPLTRLAAAAPAERALEVRIAAIAWQPLRRELRGSTDKPSFELLAEAARLREESESNPTQETLHALAVAHLVLGEPADAIETLERAAAMGPLSADARSDLAAALVAQGTSIDDPRLCARALDVIDEIETAQPPAALFNRALAFECVGQLGLAADAWTDYLATDSSGHWAAEAQEHLRSLERQRDRNQSRGSDERVDEIVDELLPQWGAAVQKDDDERAAGILERAREMALAADDQLLLRTISLLESSAGPARAELARAHASFGAARSLYREGRVTSAEEKARAARATMERFDSPFVPIVDLLLASTAYYRQDLAAVERSLASIPASGESPILEGRAAWLRGLLLHSRQELSRSVREYERAHELFTSHRAPESALVMENYLATARFDLGRPLDAWRGLARSSRDLDAFPPARRYTLLEAMVNGAARSDLTTLARQVAGEALAAAVASGRSDLIAGALALPVSYGESRLRRSEVVAAVAGIEDPNVRVRAEDTINVWMARAEAEREPEAAIHDATAVIERDRGAIAPYVLADAYLARGLARARVGEIDGAEQDFALAIAHTSARTADASSELDAMLAKETQATAWREWIDLLWRAGRRDEAHVRVLEARGARPHDGLDGSARLILWPGSVDTLGWLELDVDDVIALDLDLPVAQAFSMREQLESERDASATILEALAPIARVVRAHDVTELRILASSPYDSFPWAAVPLRDGRPMAEEVVVSLTLGHGTPARCDRRHLVAAMGSSKSVDELPSLRYVDDELDLVRSLYPDQDEDDSRCGVLHYAGHARVRELRSEVFVGEQTLRAAELGARWPHEVAVLSACSTGTGTSLLLSGSLSHARELLSAGTSAVIATLWPISDGASSALLTDLHRGLSNGAVPSDALAMAQRNAIARGDRQPEWSGWISITD